MIKKNKIIAEIGSTHDGDIKLAIKSIKKAAECGADYIKFQMHIAEEETLKTAPNPPYFNKENRYDYFKRTSFSIAEWKKIILECKKNKVKFLCSAFSIESVKILKKLKVKEIKVPSGELTNLPMIKKIVKLGFFTFISTGMSNYKEISNALRLFRNKKKVCLMQCTSIYPCDDKSVGLNVIDEFKKRYNCLVGFSDHTLDKLSAIISAVKGVSFIEKHFTLSKKLYGSDAIFAMEPDEFRDYVNNIKRTWKLLKKKVDKNNLTKFRKMKKIFEKSIVINKSLKKGHKITFNDLTYLKPGDGIRADKLNTIIGKKLLRSFPKLTKLKMSFLR